MIYINKDTKDLFFPLVGHNKADIEEKNRSRIPWVKFQMKKIGSNATMTIINLVDKNEYFVGKTDLLVNYLYFNENDTKVLLSLFATQYNESDGECEYSISDLDGNKIGQGLITISTGDKTDKTEYKEYTKLKQYEG